MSARDPNGDARRPLGAEEIAAIERALTQHPY